MNKREGSTLSFVLVYDDKSIIDSVYDTYEKTTADRQTFNSKSGIYESKENTGWLLFTTTPGVKSGVYLLKIVGIFRNFRKI